MSDGWTVTSGRGGLMTNWLNHSQHASYSCGPAKWLYSLCQSPLFLSLSLSLSAPWSSLSLSPFRVSNTPPPSACLSAPEEALWEFNCLVFPWSQVHYINSYSPHCILLTCCNLFLYLLGWQSGGFPLSWGSESDCAWVREKVRVSWAGTCGHCDAPVGRVKTWQGGTGEKRKALSV